MKFDRQQEILELKTISPEIFLNYFGIEFKWEKNVLRHYAVWRAEAEPSVDWSCKNGQWIFIDRGLNRGGSIIDFYMLLTDKDYITAVKELRDIFLLGKNNIRVKPQISPYKPKQDKGNGITYQIKKINATIQNKALLEYLKLRGISLIPDWLKEIYWIQNSKNYFGLGIQDQNGNWIIRNKYMKANLGENITYSWFKNNTDTAIIVEGIFDALTAHQIFNNKVDIISLNSVNNIQKLLEPDIYSDDDIFKYQTIILCLDNDNAGLKAEDTIIKHVKDLEYNIKLQRLPVISDLNKDFINRKNANFKEELETIYQDGIDYLNNFIERS